ncbi:MAG: hypothetical protein ACP5RX_00195 [Minisyncoccia bacterium]
MKRKNIIFISSILVLFVLLGLEIILKNKHNTQNLSFPLRDIQLGKINSQSKEVLNTNSFMKGDEFLISGKNYVTKIPATIILVDSNRQKDIFLSQTTLSSGDNKICCFEAPKDIGHYNLKFIIGIQEYDVPFEVQDKLTEYQDFNLLGVGTISYPRWSVLDVGLINNLITDVFSYYSKDLSKGVSTLLVVQDENGAQFSITQRMVSNYKNLPFGNLVQTITESENKALLKARLIDDYTILNKQYGDKEMFLKVRTITKGMSYIVFNKTYLEKSFLGKRFLLSISLTCPERLVDFYQPIADYIFSHIKLSSTP